MSCRACHWPNAPHRRFCGGCGERLTRNCAQCDFVNTLQDRFCGGCGGGLGLPVDASGGDLARALPRPAPAGSAAAPALPATRVSQDDLDSLFGNGG